MAKYNLTEPKDKAAKYRSRLSPELVEKLHERIFQKLIVEKKYRAPDYSAKLMAEELHTNSRYISAVLALAFGQNYTGIVNEYRVKDAMYLLTDKRYLDMNVEDIGLMVGFASRQSFYSAFFRFRGETPRSYRLRNTEV